VHAYYRGLWNAHPKLPFNEVKGNAMIQSAATLRLYSFVLSGHAHRVQLFLSLLNLPHEVIDVELRKGEHKQPAFLAKNPFGQVPVIEDGELTLYDSNAILVYLAKRYGAQWLPEDPLDAAAVQQWLSLTAGPIAYGPAAARKAAVFAGTNDDKAKAAAVALFDVLERLLATRTYAIGHKPTIADVAAYSYLAHAPEGGVSLAPYPSVRAWLARIEELPGFIPMPAAPVQRAA
jgi:glutathione S-transferase